MNTQFIILAQPATTAMIEIALLLLGALLIGFLTAWFYQKSVFTPIIKGLETDKENLNKTIEGLNNDIAGLKTKIGGLETKISELEKAIAQKDKEIELLKQPKKQSI